MSDQEILEKAIQKAIDGGWKGEKPHYDDIMDQWCVSDGDGGYVVPSIIELIFSHDFAKALWGTDDDYIDLPGTYTPAEKWQGHLMEMVIADDPIAYLGEHLDD